MNATMTLREVRTRDWAEFCERLNQLEGAIVSIELIDLQGARTEIARNVQFNSISFGKLDACSDQFLIEVKDNRTIRHSVVEPLHVKLEETEGGRAHDCVLLEGENGTTVLRLHPVIRSSLLAGFRFL